MINEIKHKPVMLKESIEFLNLRKGMTIVDATVGTGGHAIEVLKMISPSGKLIGIDRDKDSLELAKENLEEYKSQCVFVNDNFSNIDKILEKLKIDTIDGALLDLGISSFQLDDYVRGFSFSKEGKLDMRMDRKVNLSAFDLVNNLTQKEIASILWNFGEERYSSRIARAIVENRRFSAINTTTQLVDLVSRALPHFGKYQRIHPATRTFQALRIAVNQELASLDLFLNKIGKFLKKDARVCIISFHSLEDRIVKKSFRALSATDQFRLVFKKPLIPNQDEMNDNPRSRSAKFRVLERA